MNIQKIDINSQDYPPQLREAYNPPKQLYCVGDTSLLKSRMIVAVIGTRRASPYGRWISRAIGESIAKSGATHLGGMSEGIQNESHKAVLDERGGSIAILGTGIDICYPKSASSIYAQLAKSGLLVSEYEPGCMGKPSCFVERNRLIAGLAHKIVVVEANMKSGSVITTNMAIAGKKGIYAVPGNINQPGSAYPNSLIEDGAIPITSIDNIAEQLAL